MKKLLTFVGMTIGSYFGWWLGAFVSIFTAFVVSMVGTGLGLWLGYKASKRFF